MRLIKTVISIFLFAAFLYGNAFALVDLNKDEKENEPVVKKSQLMQKIEAKLGRELTGDEKRAYLVAVRKAISEIETIQQKFVKDISDITDITTDKIWDWIPQQGKEPDPKYKKMFSKIEKEMGRKLKQSEIDEIMKADKNKKKAIFADQEKFAKELSGITGIPVKDIMLMLPKAGTPEK